MYLKFTDQKKKRKFVAEVDYSSMVKCRKNSPLYFEGYLETFLGIVNIYVFIARHFSRNHG